MSNITENINKIKTEIKELNKELERIKLKNNILIKYDHEELQKRFI